MKLKFIISLENLEGNLIDLRLHKHNDNMFKLPVSIYN